MTKKKSIDILNYVKGKIYRNQFPTRKDIETTLKVDLRQYFKNIEELYRTLNLDYTPIKNKIVSDRISNALKVTRRFKTKNEGRKIILQWVKSQMKCGIKPGHKDIINKFKINLRSYFPEGIYKVYNLIGIKYDNKFSQKTPEQKNKMRNKIMKFIKSEFRKDIILNKKSIQKTFKICFENYFTSLRTLYKLCGLEEQFLIYSRTSIRRNFKNEIRDLVVNFIKGQIRNEKYPRFREIQEKFGININSYFQSISDAYRLAGVNYFNEQNIFTSYKKQELLREISIQFLKKRGYRILKPSNAIGEDILISDRKDNFIPVELKAYHKSISLPNKFPYINKNHRDEREQLIDYIRKYNSPYGILITSTSKIRSDMPNNIKLIRGEVLLEFLKNNKKLDLIKKLEWIRNTYVNSSKTFEIQNRRKMIVDYFKQSIKSGSIPTTREIEKKFNIDLRTYFPKRIYELYECCGIRIPS